MRRITPMSTDDRHDGASHRLAVTRTSYLRSLRRTPQKAISGTSWVVMTTTYRQLVVVISTYMKTHRSQVMSLCRECRETSCNTCMSNARSNLPSRSPNEGGTISKSKLYYTSKGQVKKCGEIDITHCSESDDSMSASNSLTP